VVGSANGAVHYDQRSEFASSRWAGLARVMAAELITSAISGVMLYSLRTSWSRGYMQLYGTNVG